MAATCHYPENYLTNTGRGHVEQVFATSRGTSSSMPTQKEYADSRCIAISEWLTDAITQDFWGPKGNTVNPRGALNSFNVDSQILFKTISDALCCADLPSSRESASSEQLSRLSQWQQMFSGTRHKAPRLKAMDNPGTSSISITATMTEDVEMSSSEMFHRGAMICVWPGPVNGDTLFG